ncbi:MAG: hypothetical protein ACRCVX_02345 [Shewanella sp.]
MKGFGGGFFGGGKGNGTGGGGGQDLSKIQRDIAALKLKTSQTDTAIYNLTQQESALSERVGNLQPPKELTAKDISDALNNKIAGSNTNFDNLADGFYYVLQRSDIPDLPQLFKSDGILEVHKANTSSYITLFGTAIDGHAGMWKAILGPDGKVTSWTRFIGYEGTKALIDAAVTKLKAGESIDEAAIATLQKEVAKIEGSPTKPFTLTGDDIAKAVDRGTFSGSGSLKSLAAGWWLIPDSNSGATGRPADSGGDLMYFTQQVSTDSTKWVGLAFGQDKAGADSMWVQYKLDGNWTPWMKIGPSPAGADLSGITSQIDAIKKGDSDMMNKITQLQTAAGSLFAPTKALFDAEANSLIAARTDPIQTQLTALQQKVDAIPHGGGTTPVVNPQPNFWVVFSNSVPTDVSRAVHSNSGQLEVNWNSPQQQGRMWVIVNKTDAASVKTIQVGDSMPSVWDSRDFTDNGSDYTGFYSAGGFTNVHEIVKVKFGG